MPASSGDPVVAALHHSLSLKSCKGADSVDSKLIGSTKRILFSEIEYEKYHNTSTANLDSLKSKYIVLSTTSNGIKPQVEKEIAVTATTPEVAHARNVGSGRVARVDAVLPTPKRILYLPEAVQLGWRGTVPVGAGMVNLGNTCYLNSTLQALFHVPAFFNWLNDKSHTAKCEALNGLTQSECLICAMHKTLTNAQRNTGTAIKPIQVYSKLKSICKTLVHGHQEDAHEFLRTLIEGMAKSYLTSVSATKLDSISKETTPLNQIFGGYLRTEVTCLACGHVSTTFAHFQELFMDIQAAVTVEDALDSYFSRERLGDGDEAYKCNGCCKPVPATKKYKIERPPKVLIVQLKRFATIGAGKNNKHVDLHHELDLTRYCHHPSGSSSPRLTYRLVSLISHLGQSANCGHYTAIGNTSGGQFYLFDDSLVRPVTLASVLSTNPYIIFYEMDSPVPQYQKTPTKSQVTHLTTKPTSNGFSNGIYSKQNGIMPSTSAARPNVTSTESSHNRSPALKFRPTLPTASKLVKLSNGSSSPSPSRSKSLVPYMSNESSDSESDSNKTGVVGGTGQKWGGDKVSVSLVQNNGDATGKSSPHKVMSNGSPGDARPIVGDGRKESEPVEPRKSSQSAQADLVGQTWHVTEIGQGPAVSSSPVNSCLGKWDITISCKQPQSSEDTAGNNKEPPLDRPKPQPCDGSSITTTPGATAVHLSKMSHRDYGANNVFSWSGERSQLDKETENEKKSRKRTFNDLYIDDFDKGKMPARTNANHHHHHSRSQLHTNYNNPFQGHQNWQNLYSRRSYQKQHYHSAKNDFYRRSSNYMHRNNYNNRSWSNRQ